LYIRSTAAVVFSTENATHRFRSPVIGGGLSWSWRHIQRISQPRLDRARLLVGVRWPCNSVQPDFALQEMSVSRGRRTKHHVPCCPRREGSSLRPAPDARQRMIAGVLNAASKPCCPRLSSSQAKSMTARP